VEYKFKLYTLVYNYKSGGLKTQEKNKMKLKEKIKSASIAETKKIDLATKLTQSYITEFDDAFVKGYCDSCKKIEKQYDKEMKKLGMVPGKLYEFVVETEDLGRPLEEAVTEYITSLGEQIHSGSYGRGRKWK